MGNILEDHFPDDKPYDPRKRDLYGYRFVHVASKRNYEIHFRSLHRTGRKHAFVGDGVDIFPDCCGDDCACGRDSFEFRILSAPRELINRNEERRIIYG